MVPAEMHDVLRDAATRVGVGTCIVEVGAWLGAVTASLALGAREAEPSPDIIVQDRFSTTKEEAEKAQRFGMNLDVGGDTRPRAGGARWKPSGSTFPCEI